MSDIKISVVVAVYNIEEYIEACIKSVAEQSFDSFEVILVDDGSLDSSGEICEVYAEKYENVSVYHKENGGLSDARNFGLSKAKGEYVLFADGDDLLLPKALNTLYGQAEATNADIVIGEARLSKPSEAMERFEKIAREAFEEGKPYSGKEYLLGCLSKGALRVEAWRNLYRKEFLINNSLAFKCGIAHEDEEFTPRALLAAEIVVLTKEPFYYYNNDRTGSIMNSENHKKVTDKLTIYNELLEIYKYVKPRRLKRLLEDDVTWKYLECYSYKGLDPKLFKRLLPLRCAYSFKRRVKALMFAVSPRLFVKLFK